MSVSKAVRAEPVEALPFISRQERKKALRQAQGERVGVSFDKIF
jgi:hypothetical protein